MYFGLEEVGCLEVDWVVNGMEASDPTFYIDFQNVGDV